MTSSMETDPPGCQIFLRASAARRFGRISAATTLPPIKVIGSGERQTRRGEARRAQQKEQEEALLDREAEHFSH